MNSMSAETRRVSVSSRLSVALIDGFSNGDTFFADQLADCAGVPENGAVSGFLHRAKQHGVVEIAQKHMSRTGSGRPRFSYRLLNKDAMWRTFKQPSAGGKPGRIVQKVSTPDDIDLFQNKPAADDPSTMATPEPASSLADTALSIAADLSVLTERVTTLAIAFERRERETSIRSIPIDDLMNEIRRRLLDA